MGNSLTVRRPISHLEVAPRILIGAALLAATILGLTIAGGHWLLTALLLAAILVLLAPVPMALGCFALLVPFDSILALGNSGNDGSRTLTFLVGAGTAATLVFVGFAGRRFVRPPRTAWWWSGFLLWGIVSVAWALSASVSFRQLPTFLALVGLYLVTVCVRIEPNELRWVLLLAIAGGCAAALFAIYGFAHGEFYEGATLRASLIVGGREANPNGFAVALLLPLSLSLPAFSLARRKVPILLLFAAMCTMVFAIFYTMSRGGLLAVAVLFAVHFYRSHNRKKFIPFLVAIAAAFLVMPSNFYQRLAQASATGGAGRLDIWRAGWVLLQQHAIFGAGLSNFPVAYNSVAGYARHFEGYGRAAHNMYLSVTVELGVIGLALLLAALVVQFRAAARVRPHNDRQAALLVGCEAACWSILVAAFFADAQWYKAFWLALMFFAVLTRLHEEKKPEPSVA